jgi:hypothetical protein
MMHLIYYYYYFLQLCSLQSNATSVTSLMRVLHGILQPTAARACHPSRPRSSDDLWMTDPLTYE